MAPVVAGLDSNLLVPVVACDFLLTAFDHGLFEPVVSGTTLEEVERTLIDDFPQLDADALRRRVAAMRELLEDHTIETSSAADVLTTINAKDRHVVAAALAVDAAVVVTNDAALRAQIIASGLDLEPLDGDTFALRLWRALPDDVGRVIDDLIAKRRRPPVTARRMAGQLGVHFPSMIRAWLDA